MHRIDDDVRAGIVMFGPAFIGGAEKRYSNFYTYARAQGMDIKLLVNSCLYETLHGMALLDADSDSNITVVEHAVERGYRSHFTLDHRSPAVDAAARLGKSRRPGLMRKLFSALKLHWLYLDVWKKTNHWRKQNHLNVLHGVFQGAYALTPYYFNHKVATVISYVDSSFTLLERQYLKWFFGFRQGLRRADQIEFLSEFILNGLLERGYDLPSERVNVAPCSFIDYKHCVPIEKKEHTIAFCGRLIPYKNPLLMVEAMPEIIKNFPEAFFIIMGKGPLEKAVKERISQLGLEKCVQLGFQARPTDVLRYSRIFVSLQETNNYPSQSLLEAMACENAVIATDVGETGKLIDDKTGVLIPKSATDLAQAVVGLLREKDKMCELGRNARKRVLTEQTVGRFAHYLFDVYFRAVAYREHSFRSGF